MHTSPKQSCLQETNAPYKVCNRRNMFFQNLGVHMAQILIKISGSQQELCRIKLQYNKVRKIL